MEDYLRLKYKMRFLTPSNTAAESSACSAKDSSRVDNYVLYIRRVSDPL